VEGKVRYGEDGLLLTATEIAENVAGRLCAECYPTYDELKSRNAELEALLKEVMATRDEAIKQNDELITENKKLKAENGAWQVAAQTCADNAKVADNATEELRKENKELLAAVDKLKDTIVDRTKDVQHLTEENANLKAWYEEANKTASEAAEANDELKAKIADLRNRVGEQLAQIQDLNAEVHFHKEFGEGLDKQQKELQARYDELDSVNKEQAEKIRKLDAQNAYLKRLSDAKKKMRIVLNNGSMYDVEVGDKVHPVYDMNNNLFFVKTEGGTVTSFLIGKEPGNIAGWYFV
jgi:chromosome segregation ATPase